MTRYLLGTTFEGGVVDTPIEEWKPEEIQAHLDYYGALNRELIANGDLTGSEILTGPDLAKIATFGARPPCLNAATSRCGRPVWSNHGTVSKNGDRLRYRDESAIPALRK